ncbi:MAG: heavy metal translocating P-type ATPase [Candidatus Binataceae bacterium]
MGGIAFEVIHSTPGRVRLRVPMLANFDAPVEQFKLWLKKRPHVRQVRINWLCGAVVVDYDPNQADLKAQLAADLRCVDPESLALFETDAPASTVAEEPARWLFTNLEPHGWPALTLATAGVAASILGSAWAPFAVTLSAYSALPSFHRAFDALRHEQRLNVDFLDSLAICISTMQGNVFTTAFMTWLITLGDWIRDQTAAQSKRAIGELLDYQRKRAWVLRDKEKISLPVDQIAAGDVVVVYDGEMIPVDGIVIDGDASVDQRTITGEALPVLKQHDDKVYAASVVHEGKLYVRAERIASESLAAEIVRMVESVPVGETRMQNYAEKFADQLVAPSLGLGGALYLLTHDLNRTLSMLIIDFGTGIRVAAPTSVLASMSAAVRRGVLIRGGSCMERLSRLESIVFDKTGTLTLGSPEVIDIISYDGKGFPAPKVLQLAAAAELRLSHPVATAILNKAVANGVSIPDRSESKYHVGMGVEAWINGYHVHAGSARFLRENSIGIKRAQFDCQRASRNGQSSLMLAVNGEMVGQLIYEDQIRPEGAHVIEALKLRAIRDVVMLTGDNGAAARHVADALGINQLYAEILPHEKAEVVKHLRDRGRMVGMVGDGINDAAALSYADVGIAMKNGTDLAQHSAHVVLMRDDLVCILDAIDISRGAVKLIHQNYSIVVALNLAALAMALAGGMVRPELTALISNGSAVLASVNGLRPLVQ